ncbi:MAG: MEDS domain-containing protein [Mycobacteriaceae bacterium]|nr:MEDS domain-containing protein [Mycobacteriaceae bacterium]MBV9513829.1 MEDS domain-containing protein [Mycobacteriaceae bacterium]
MTELVRFIVQGLSQNEGVVVVATAAHCAAITNAFDCRSEVDSGALVILDAADTLQKFMIDGVPDPALFEATIGGIVDAAASRGRRVRLFGEMVAVLWDQGNITGALALEALWNDLAESRQFFLMCAYPSTSFDDGSLDAVNSVCQLHSEVALLGYGVPMPDRFDGSDADARKLFVPVPAAVFAARLFTVDTLTDWGLSQMTDDAALIVTELAANAVVHAKSAFRVVISRTPSGVRLAVDDAAHARPQLRHAGPHDITGRGVALVATIAHQWGSDVFPGGKTVWADVRA